MNDCWPTLVNTDFNETLFTNLLFLLINVVEIVNTNYEPYAQLCVQSKVKNMNVQLFNLVLGMNEKRFLIQHDSC